MATPSPSLENLPGVLRRIGETCGVGVALTLAAEYGSRNRLYVPVKPRLDCALCQLIGWDALVELCQLYGGEEIEIPRAVNAQNKKGQIMDAPEGSAVEVATATGCTTRYVRKVRAELRADPDQPTLL